MTRGNECQVQRVELVESDDPGPAGVQTSPAGGAPAGGAAPSQLAAALHTALALAGADAGAVVVCRPDGRAHVAATEGLGPAELARVRQLGSVLEREVTPPPTVRADAPPAPDDHAPDHAPDLAPDLAPEPARAADRPTAADRALPSAEARAAGEAKSEFLAMMSHELRTPLNAIVGYTGLLADEVVGPINPTQRTQLHRVQDQARHLLSLIEEILTLSRAEAGPQGLQLEVVDPAALLHDVVAVLAPSARRKGLALEAVVETPMGPASLDAAKVRQVLAHLLTNAVKFTHRGGVVASVRQATVGDRPVLAFAVRDTGVGIAPEDLDHIFEPFWQAERTHARRAAGTGLGLNVTRRLADLLGGEVRVASTLGQGSTFEFVLPTGAEA